MCCCGKPTINGELGYKWQPNDAPSIRKPNAPKLINGETLVYDEPGRCGGLDMHSHHFSVTKWLSTHYLLVAHGGGDERIKLFSLMAGTLASMDSDTRYKVLHAIYSAHRDGSREAAEHESATWRKAAAEKRIKTRKQPSRGVVKVWIEPAA